MGSEASSAPGSEFRRAVRFYLLDHKTPLGKSIDIGLLLLNLLFVAIFVVETYPISAGLRSTLQTFDLGIALVFLVEYVLRLYGAEDRVGEATDPYAIADLLAILPTLLFVAGPAFAVVNLAFLRVVRVVRVLRFYRFTRDAEFFFGTVTDNTLRAMKLVTTIIVILFVSAGLFYSTEHRVNPAVATFGDAFYYTVVTLSTVGFGDIIPVTEGGRWVTVASVLAAIVLIPRQASHIVREWTTRDQVDVTCPQCGLRFHDQDASHCKACGHVIYQEHDARE